MRRIVFLFLFSLTILTLYSQSAVVSSGESVKSIGGSVSYSVGQVFTEVVTDGVHSIHHGVQQGYTMDELSVPDVLSLDVVVNVYPNPVIESVYVSLSGYSDGAFMAVLYDGDGKQLCNYLLNKEVNELQMGSYIGGKVYYLTVYYNGVVYRSYKLLKQDR